MLVHGDCFFSILVLLVLSVCAAKLKLHSKRKNYWKFRSKSIRYGSQEYSLSSMDQFHQMNKRSKFHASHRIFVSFHWMCSRRRDMEWRLRVMEPTGFTSASVLLLRIGHENNLTIVMLCSNADSEGVRGLCRAFCVGVPFTLLPIFPSDIWEAKRNNEKK